MYKIKIYVLVNYQIQILIVNLDIFISFFLKVNQNITQKFHSYILKKIITILIIYKPPGYKNYIISIPFIDLLIFFKLNILDILHCC